MSTAFVLPVLWKDASAPSIQGLVDIASSELPRRRIEDATVLDLITTLNGKFDRTAFAGDQRVRQVDAIHLYGTRLKPERSLAAVIITLSASCPRLMATTSSRPRPFHKLKIFVQPPNGRPLLLCCALEETIDDVKLKIQGRTGILASEQLLTFGGKPLDGQLTLFDYNAHSECTLHLVLRLRGGFTDYKQFADVSDDSLLRPHAFSDRAPQWRKVTQGLNLEGRCETPSCAALGHWIIHCVGFDSFNLNLDGFIPCPMCASKVTPLTCLFYECAWKFEGVRAHDRNFVSSPWKNALGPRYHRFDVHELVGIIAWESLLIVVQSSEVSQAAKLVSPPGTPVKSRDEVCSVCWSPQATKKKFLKISCGHRVHRACIDEWSVWCKRSHVLFSCPVCRKDLSTQQAVEWISF